MKYILSPLVLLLSAQFLTAQQNPHFKSVSSTYQTHKSELYAEFKRLYPTLSHEQRTFLVEELHEVEKKMDSLENAGYIHSLIKTKIEENLSVPSNTLITPFKGPTEKEIIAPQYPGGIQALRNEVAELFYMDATGLPSTLSTRVHFEVDTLGAVRFARAEGENLLFNRQAEIALYRLSGTFVPALDGQQKVPYRFQMPFTMRFE